MQPVEWKSEIWWRNRPADERVANLHLPPRLSKVVEDEGEQFAKDWIGKDIVVVSNDEALRNKWAAHLLVGAARNYPISGRWIDADDYLEMLKDSFSSDDGYLPEAYSNPYLIKYIRAVFDTVVIADLGEERKTDFAVHELGNLVRKRHQRMKHTIITTRLTYAELLAKYGERIASALSEYEVVNAR